MSCRWRSGSARGSENHFPFNNSDEDVTSGASRYPHFLLLSSFCFIFHLLMSSTSSLETGLTTAYCPVSNKTHLVTAAAANSPVQSKQTNELESRSNPSLCRSSRVIISPRVSISTTQLQFVATLLRGNSSNHQLLLFTQAKRLPKTKTSSAMLPSSPSSSPPPPSLRLPGPSAFTGQSIYKVRSFHCIQTEFYSCR